MIEENRLLRLPDVRRLTGLSRSTLYRLSGTGNFPERVQLTLRTVAWRAKEVAAWNATRQNAPPLRTPPTK
jgi:prophage regulatory protein